MVRVFSRGNALPSALHPHNVPVRRAADGTAVPPSHALVSRQLSLTWRGTVVGIVERVAAIDEVGVESTTEAGTLLILILPRFRDGCDGMIGEGEAEECDEFDELHDGKIDFDVSFDRILFL